ncbi:MAG TPA: Ldh family oxidoreductase [Pirellulaceae bacterium]|jgi:uncharacterized oxidoreductase|nr:Ldh family oxidoreductase [Pirellulaceae bacterium]
MRIQHLPLRAFAADLFESAGVPREDAEIVAASLVEANLRGYDSHGVMRLPFYLEMVANGDIVPGAELSIVDEGTARIFGDAQWGFGAVQARRLLDRLEPKARAEGISLGTLRHCSHVGRLGEYLEIAADRNLISLMMVNTHGGVVRVAPPGGTCARLGTNPLAIGVPCEGGALTLDFSTSAVAEGKVRVHHIAGKPVPEGWIVDSKGRPTSDPATLYANPPGAILPMGGTQSYKGFGLGLMVEILTGSLSGGATPRDQLFPKKGNCVFLALIDPDRFAGAAFFERDVREFVEWVRGCPPVEGNPAITLPGDPERAYHAQRLVDGLDFDEENWNRLVQVAKTRGVAVPEPVEA